jgi:predicted metal-dependent hydrolase
MREHLRAGVAVYNAGHYHAAHDAWEDHWIDLKRAVPDAPSTVEEVGDEAPLPGDPSPEADERLLHGLIQFTAAVHHLDGGNQEGALGLAESGRAYLDPLPREYRAVDVETVRSFLDSVVDDPEAVESLPELTHESRALSFVDLDFPATAVAAEVLAEEFGDEDTVGSAIEYARTDLANGEAGSQFVALVFDYVREPDDRGIVLQRLGDHVSRRRHREEDVEGLF